MIIINSISSYSKNKLSLPLPRTGQLFCREVFPTRVLCCDRTLWTQVNKKSLFQIVNKKKDCV